MSQEIREGDCRALLAEMADESVEAICTDPPYEIGFMSTGKEHWDNTGIAFDPEVWAQALRVLKPGGHLLAFGSPRTYHRVAVAIEDAGFEIRDCIGWVHGQGWPKGRNISKAIDAQAGAEREVIGTKLGRPGMAKDGSNQRSGFLNEQTGRGGEPLSTDITAPATPEAEQWDGWSTQLKPAWESIVMARKPLEGNAVECVLSHGTGAINADGCRIPAKGRPALESAGRDDGNEIYGAGVSGSRQVGKTDEGRYPANLTMDADAAEALDRQSGVGKDGVAGKDNGEGRIFQLGGREDEWGTFGGEGGASRFFHNADWGEGEWPLVYSPKSSRRERDAGVPGGNLHLSVKPISLMRWLVRLVTPPEVYTCAACDSSDVNDETLSDVRETVQASTERADSLLDSMSQSKSRAGEPSEAQTESLPDLRDEIPSTGEAESVLLDQVPGESSQGAGGAVPDLRQVDPVEKGPRRSEVLLEGMRDSTQDGRAVESEGSAVPGVRGSVRRQASPEESRPPESVLRSKVRKQVAEQDRSGTLKNIDGVHQSAPTKSPKGNKARSGDGASGSDGEGAGAVLGTEGGGSSSQRDQGRQSPGESEGDDRERPQPTAQEATTDGEVSSLRESSSGQGEARRCGRCGGPVTKRRGLVLDIFAGSGSTGCAAYLEGLNFIGMELDPEHVRIARHRIEWVKGGNYRPPETEGEAPPGPEQLSF